MIIVNDESQRHVLNNSIDDIGDVIEFGLNVGIAVIVITIAITIAKSLHFLMTFCFELSLSSSASPVGTKFLDSETACDGIGIVCEFEPHL